MKNGIYAVLLASALSVASAAFAASPPEQNLQPDGPIQVTLAAGAVQILAFVGFLELEVTGSADVGD